MKKPITIDNYKNLTFSKIICEYYAGPGDEKNQYDILMPIDDELSDIEKNSIYFNQLLDKFDKTKTNDREEFLDYQLKKYGKRSKDWLFELFDFLENYEQDINAKRPNLAEDFKRLIDVKLKRFPRTSISRLVWDTENFTDTDFLVLTKALFNLNAVVRLDGKKITQKEIDLTLERAFNLYVPNKGKKLNSACNTEGHGKKKAFTLLLHEAWKQYVLEKLG